MLALRQRAKVAATCQGGLRGGHARGDSYILGLGRVFEPLKPRLWICSSYLGPRLGDDWWPTHIVQEVVRSASVGIW